MTEKILCENPDRWVLFPIRNHAVWDMYKQAVASIWTVEEVDLTQDVQDWNQLSDNERHFISHVLAFFAASDGIVNENLVANFCDEVQIPEARCFYGFQIAIENIHSEMYALLLQTYVKDAKKLEHLRRAIFTIPTIQKKAEWTQKWFARSRPFAERIVAFSVVEGLFFSGSFCAIFWLKKQGKMPGLGFSNELISRDEGLHTKFACLLYSMLEGKLDDERVHEIVREAVALEHEFIMDAIPASLLGMNSGMMKQYICFVADVLLRNLGHSELYKVQNPFEWMTLISLQGKTNFFEKRVGEYAKANVGTDEAGGHFQLDMDADF